MEIEIIFHSASTPKKISEVDSLYTKGNLLCVQLESGLIIKYPLQNIFSVCHQHAPHLGATNKEGKEL